MKLKLNRKYNTVALYSIAVFTICLLLVAIIFRASSFIPYVHKFFSVCSPIFVGIGIAYLLNPVVGFFERMLAKIPCKLFKSKKFLRFMGIAITYIITGALITVIIASIIPELINSIKNLITSVPSYYVMLLKEVDKLSLKYPELSKFIQDQLNNSRGDLFSHIANFETILDGLFSNKGLIANVTGGALNVINFLKNFFIGLIIAIYLHFSKEYFIAQMKKAVFGIFNHKHASSILRYSAEANTIFSKFITGKAIDSLIIGIICFIGTSIMNLPYAVLVSCIVGVTNMIPVFGPFIGGIPSALLILLTSGFNDGVAFVIFIIVLQQFDGNILGPKILGSQLGISAFWIMVSVIIGGGCFGVIGMIIAVPIFAFISTIVSGRLNKKLLKKQLPIDIDDYKEV